MHAQDGRRNHAYHEWRAIRALTCLEEFPADAIIPGKHGEEPDFLLFHNGLITGIEIVRYIQPDIKERASFADHICRRIVERCRRERLGHTFGWLEIDPLVGVSNRNAPDVIDWAVESLRPIARSEVKTVDVHRKAQLPTGLRQLWATRRENPPVTFIGRAHGGLTETVQEGELETFLARKEMLLHKVYRRRCDRVWLLVVVDSREVACMAHVPRDLRLHSSSFDRVVALQTWTYTRELWRAAA